MAAERHALRLAALALALSAAVATAGGPPVLEVGDGGTKLKVESALLLVAIESQQPVAGLKLQRLIDGKKKRSVELKLTPSSKFSAAVVVLEPGTYKLEWLKLGSYKWKLEDQTPFELKAGAVNYIGDLGLNDAGRGTKFTVNDRSGRARVWLQENHDGLLLRFGLRFAGTEDDGWTGTLR